ncbi:DNA-binding response regulator [Emticicia aquatilis]|uniref:DNA-binding response regulator n=1 Tax=Emticicia aquatilis TaxID=1537369 RepID=A0A917DZ15_9BACT|nr:response regulator transcription factor [Emticicia aquatilis]GGD83552.1 DNA-binding response regulator [Emticicia aquatilis]
MPVRVLLYEDNPKLRVGLSFLLESSAGIEFLDSYENCENIDNQILSQKPDVVLMDIDMPIADGFSGLKTIRKHSNSIQVVMLTVFDSDEHIFEALKLGANGYLLKTTSPAQIVEGVLSVHEGGVPMSAAIARKVLAFMSQKNTQNIDYQLTKREKEVLENLVKGLSYKMIAHQIGTGIDTVRAHIKHIYEKLHVHSQTEAVAKAINERII